MRMGLMLLLKTKNIIYKQQYKKVKLKGSHFGNGRFVVNLQFVLIYFKTNFQIHIISDKISWENDSI